MLPSVTVVLDNGTVLPKTLISVPFGANQSPTIHVGAQAVGLTTVNTLLFADNVTLDRN